MKKFLCMILVLCSLFSLVACGTQDQKPAPTEQQGNNVTQGDKETTAPTDNNTNANEEADQTDKENAETTDDSVEDTPYSFMLYNSGKGSNDVWKTTIHITNEEYGEKFSPISNHSGQIIDDDGNRMAMLMFAKQDALLNNNGPVVEDVDVNSEYECIVRKVETAEKTSYRIFMTIVDNPSEYNLIVQGDNLEALVDIVECIKIDAVTKF